MSKERAPPEFAPELVRRISVEVYKIRLNDGSGPIRDGTTAVGRMLAQDADDGVQLAERSVCFDALSRAYLRVIGKMGPCWFK